MSVSGLLPPRQVSVKEINEPWAIGPDQVTGVGGCTHFIVGNCAITISVQCQKVKVICTFKELCSWSVLTFKPSHMTYYVELHIGLPFWQKLVFVTFYGCKITRYVIWRDFEPQLDTAVATSNRQHKTGKYSNNSSCWMLFIMLFA